MMRGQVFERALIIAILLKVRRYSEYVMYTRTFAHFEYYTFSFMTAL